MIILDYHKVKRNRLKRRAFMKKKIYYSTGLIILTFLMILLVMSFIFQQSVPDSHQAFIEEKGWGLAFYFPKKESFLVPDYPEALQTYKIAGVDFTGYENITRHRYRLTQPCDSRYLEAVILTADNKIMDSYINVSETVPGVTEMTEKDIYKKENCYEKDT
jgi:hypothetical protein